MSLRISLIERERLYATEKFVDGSLLTWVLYNGSFRLAAPVICDTGEELALRGTYGLKYSFALLWGTQSIRRWDYKRHTNPDNVRFEEAHKHPCPMEKSLVWAYPVSDIPTEDVNEALIAFLKECNITLEGTYQNLLVGGA